VEKRFGVLALAQMLVEYAEDLITVSAKDSFSKMEMLLLLNAVKNDKELVARLRFCDQAVVGLKD